MTFEIARRLVQRGDFVEWFSAGFPGAPTEETIDGVRIVRSGRQWTVHLRAFQRYRGKLARQFDVVVDEVNTIPFFTPLWSNVPVVMFVHQLAREVWWYESAFPLSAIGYLAEPWYLRLYRNVPVVTVSESTMTDLQALGLGGPITVIPEGVGAIPTLDPTRCAEPRFLYVGRLAPSKRIEDMIRALELFRRQTGSGMLWLVGDGSDRYRRSLSRLARKLGIEDRVEFRGWVSDAEKFRLMASADALLMTSVREGWGLVVSEANACGTPAIVYAVPGLRDSVRHESTGLIVPPRPQSLSDAMVRLTTEPELYARLAAEGQRWSAGFSFDEAARMVRRTLQATIAA